MTSRSKSTSSCKRSPLQEEAPVIKAGDQDLAGLEVEGVHLQKQLATVGDFRRGSVSTAYRRCGKAYCARADPTHPDTDRFIC